MYADWQVGDEKKGDARAAGGDVDGGDSVNVYARGGEEEADKKPLLSERMLRSSTAVAAIPAAVTVAAAMSSAVAKHDEEKELDHDEELELELGLWQRRRGGGGGGQQQQRWCQ